MPVSGPKALPLKAWFGRVAGRLRGRADSEHEMSFNRLAFAAAIVVYLLVAEHGQATAALKAMALYFVLAFGVLAHIILRPQTCPERRVFALLLDFGFLSWQLHVGDEETAVLFPIYLWVIFGNGFRFGLAWLRAAMVMGVVCFAAVIATTAFWRDHPSVTIGLLAGLVILPLYAGTLIRKLSQAKQVAEQASRAKSMFLASVSHEFRTPLNAIIGTGALLRDGRMDAPQQEMVTTIDHAAKSLLALIDDILDFSRIEAGELRIQCAEFDLLDLLAEVRRMVAVQARQKGLRLDLHVTARTPHHLRGGR